MSAADSDSITGYRALCVPRSVRTAWIVLALRPLLCDNQDLLAIGKTAGENQTMCKNVWQHLSRLHAGVSALTGAWTQKCTRMNPYESDTWRRAGKRRNVAFWKQNRDDYDKALRILCFQWTRRVLCDITASPFWKLNNKNTSSSLRAGLNLSFQFFGRITKLTHQ